MVYCVEGTMDVIVKMRRVLPVSHCGCVEVLRVKNLMSIKALTVVILDFIEQDNRD